MLHGWTEIAEISLHASRNRGKIGCNIMLADLGEIAANSLRPPDLLKNYGSFILQRLC